MTSVSVSDSENALLDFVLNEEDSLNEEPLVEDSVPQEAIEEPAVEELEPIVEPLPETKRSDDEKLLDFAEQEQFDVKEEDEIGRARSLLNAPTKGAAKTTASIQDEAEDFVQKFADLVGLGKSFKEAREGIRSGKGTKGEEIEKALPTKDLFAERALERAGGMFPFLLVGGFSPGSAAARSGAAGVTGQGLEDLGAPPWVVALGEAGVSSFPELLAVLRPGSGQQVFVRNMRLAGFTEDEIAPLVQSERKLNTLSRVAKKTGRSQRAIQNSRQAVSERFTHIRDSIDAFLPMAEENLPALRESIENVLMEMPSEIAGMARDDVAVLFNGDVNGRKLMNFWRNVNSYYDRGAPELGSLKRAIQPALESISSEMAFDFELANQAWARYERIAARMRPGVRDALLDASSVPRFAYGMFTGDTAIMGEVVAESAIRSMAAEMLTNPRFQDLSRKWISAMNKSRFKIATELSKEMAELIRPFDSDAADQLSNVDYSELLPKR